MGKTREIEDMIYLKDFKQGRLLYEALDSDVRLGILDELRQKGELNLAYFANRFNVSNGAITAHVKKLHAAGLIEISTSSGIRGTQKICSLAADKIVIDFLANRQEEGRVESAQIDVGQYVAYEVHPTCGLATRESIVGRFDDPACFSYPERFRAGILWLSYGYIEYLLPNYLTETTRLSALQISLELASEAPGYAAYYPSDVYFSLNGKELGTYLSKGEYNDRTGSVSPSWWYGNLGQYGKKVTVTVGADGTYIGGVKTSPTRLTDLGIRPGEQLRLRISVPENAEHRGGFTLFGKGFGDYDEGIVCTFVCK